MRVLVISDTHGRSHVIRDILLEHSDIKEVFFLGDFVKDIDSVLEDFSERNFHIVSGNCDGFSFYKNTDMCIINGVKILFTHGHTYGVKGGLEKLCEAARQRDCKLALFGHTHTAVTVYDNGLTLVNPGSAACSRESDNSYAIIDVLESGIVTSIIKIGRHN